MHTFRILITTVFICICAGNPCLKHHRKRRSSNYWLILALGNRPPRSISWGQKSNWTLLHNLNLQQQIEVKDIISTHIQDVEITTVAANETTHLMNKQVKRIEFWLMNAYNRGIWLFWNFFSFRVGFSHYLPFIWNFINYLSNRHFLFFNWSLSIFRRVVYFSINNLWQFNYCLKNTILLDRSRLWNRIILKIS